MKQAVIVGAGMSGLIVANLLKARGYDILVYEQQDILPDNHQAVLRFRSPALGEALGIPFKKVQTLLCLSPPGNPHENPLQSALAYSYATTGTRRTDRSIMRLFNGPRVVDRWIAPSDFRQILFDRVKSHVKFSHEYTYSNSPGISVIDVPVITTIPMGRSYNMVDKIEPVPSGPVAPKFKAIKYIVITAHALNIDAYGSMYNSYPCADSPWTRVSITGSRVALEVSMMWGDATSMLWDKDDDEIVGPGEFYDLIVGNYLGLETDLTKGAPKVHHSLTDRILPIPDRIRKNFIMRLTDRYNVYSLGRFATWRPGMLLDEIIQDTNIVASMIEGETAPRYEAAK